MDRRVTPTRRVTSFTRGLPPPLKQALNKFLLYGVIGHLPVECGERGMRSSKEGEDLQLCCFPDKSKHDDCIFFSQRAR